MIDLSYHKQRKAKDPEPEQIVMAVIAAVMWAIIIIGSML